VIKSDNYEILRESITFLFLILEEHYQISNDRTEKEQNVNRSLSQRESKTLLILDNNI